MTKQEHFDELADTLRAIEAGTVTVTRHPETAADDVHVAFDTSNGWTLVVFNDCDQWDYLETATAPAPQRIVYDFDALPEDLKFYRPPLDVAAHTYGIGPDSAEVRRQQERAIRHAPLHIRAALIGQGMMLKAHELGVPGADVLCEVLDTMVQVWNEQERARRWAEFFARCKARAGGPAPGPVTVTLHAPSVETIRELQDYIHENRDSLAAAIGWPADVIDPPTPSTPSELADLSAWVEALREKE